MHFNYRLLETNAYEQSADQKLFLEIKHFTMSDNSAKIPLGPRSIDKEEKIFVRM